MSRRFCRESGQAIDHPSQVHWAGRSLAGTRSITHNAARDFFRDCQSMVIPVGSLATLDDEPRQARKGATVIVKACAGVWLAGVATHLFQACIIPALDQSQGAGKPR